MMPVNMRMLKKNENGFIPLIICLIVLIIIIVYVSYHYVSKAQK
jgi:hypothetical protein